MQRSYLHLVLKLGEGPHPGMRVRTDPECMQSWRARTRAEDVSQRWPVQDPGFHPKARKEEKKKLGAWLKCRRLPSEREALSSNHRTEKNKQLKADPRSPGPARIRPLPFSSALRLDPTP